MRRWTSLAVLVALLFAGGVAAYIHSPLRLPSTPFALEVPPGTTMYGLAQQLEQAGVLRNGRLFVWLARITGRGSALKAGNYALEHPVTVWLLLDKLTRGDVAQREIRFIEGWTFAQVRAAIRAHPDLRQDTAGLSDAEIMARLGFPGQHPEGRFFPDTYYFSAGSSDLALLARAHAMMQRELDRAWQQRDAGIPLSDPEQALILASIIEKETGRADERALIAGVFANRLRIGMRLQTDPSVIYGLGDAFDGNLRKRDLLADTPYNTYTRAGLPPTPIAMPGREALLAAVRPARTPALYFVARGDGSHHFSSNLAEHNQAVSRYQKP